MPSDPNSSLKDINNPINRARQAAGLSVSDLAVLLGADLSTTYTHCGGFKSPPAWVENLILKEIKRYNDDNKELADIVSKITSLELNKNTVNTIPLVRNVVKNFARRRKQITDANIIRNFFQDYMRKLKSL